VELPGRIQPTRWMLLTYTGLALAFLYLPLLVMVLMAFNHSPLYELPITFDTIWFQKLLHNERLLRATSNSLILAAATSAAATLLGTPAALALARREFRGKAALQALLVPPITIPWLILAVALLLTLFLLGIRRGLATMFIGHVAVALPYVILVLLARLQGTGSSLEEAAASLGAPPLLTFRRITFPLILPSVVAAALFAFTVSFDNFIISHFLAPPGVSTLPVEIFSAIRKGFTPEINAVSSIIFVFSGVLILIASSRIEFSAGQ